jgi:hypothetical protein
MMGNHERISMGFGGMGQNSSHLLGWIARLPQRDSQVHDLAKAAKMRDVSSRASRLVSNPNCRTTLNNVSANKLFRIRFQVHEI